MLDSRSMDGLYLLALFLVIGVARPVFWLLTLTVLTWIGYRVLPDHVGRLLFGRYWKRKQPRLLQRSRDRSAA